MMRTNGIRVLNASVPFEAFEQERRRNFWGDDGKERGALHWSLLVSLIFEVPQILAICYVLGRWTEETCESPLRAWCAFVAARQLILLVLRGFILIETQPAVATELYLWTKDAMSVSGAVNLLAGGVFLIKDGGYQGSGHHMSEHSCRVQAPHVWSLSVALLFVGFLGFPIAVASIDALRSAWKPTHGSKKPLFSFQFTQPRRPVDSV